MRFVQTNNVQNVRISIKIRINFLLIERNAFFDIPMYTYLSFYTFQNWYQHSQLYFCLLYTSDAADDMQCVDLGGRRIIKKIFFFKQKTAY